MEYVERKKHKLNTYGLMFTSFDYKVKTCSRTLFKHRQK